MLLEAIAAAVPHMPSMDDLDRDITVEEIEWFIKALKNNKVPRSDGILPELIKCGGALLVNCLHHLYQCCWREKCIPSDIKDANIITLYKNKGDRQDCNNYRGISLLSLPGKCLARSVLPRLQRIANHILPESGFHPGRCTLDISFSIRQLQEKCLEQQHLLHIVFNE